jgi:hypothetical protein
MKMHHLLFWYVVGGIVWLLWSNSQGYVTGILDKLIWPVTAFRQVRDANAVAKPT